MQQFKRFQRILFLALLAFVSLAFVWVVHDYLMPVFWAVVFGIIFMPVHHYLLKYLKFPALSSATTIVFMLIVIFVPLFATGMLAFREAASLYEQVTTSTITNDVSVDLFDRFADTTVYLEQVGVSEEEIRTRLNTFAAGATNWLTTQVVSLGGKTFTVTLQFFLMLYILFFLFKDGDRIKEKLIHILPLGDKREKKLFAKFTSTTRAVVKGTLIVGIVQGGIGGILFAIAGIQAAILWGVLMTILSVVPAIGTVFVWLPAGVILLATGAIWQGLFILISGALIISLIDNILRPILVEHDTKIPDVIVLLSTLGGLSVFGITGFVIGPVIAGFFMVMWEMFEEEYHKELVKYG